MRILLVTRASILCWMAVLLHVLLKPLLFVLLLNVRLSMENDLTRRPSCRGRIVSGSGRGVRVVLNHTGSAWAGVGRIHEPRTRNMFLTRSVLCIRPLVHRCGFSIHIFYVSLLLFLVFFVLGKLRYDLLARRNLARRQHRLVRG